MGGWMTYRRVRARNLLLPSKPLNDPDPYWRGDDATLRPVSWPLVVGDLDRMERDYLAPEYPREPCARRPDGSDPATACGHAIGVDVAIVRQVLEYVFRQQL